MSAQSHDEDLDETLTVSVPSPKTEQPLEISQEESQELKELDLAHLRDLLGLLNEFRVAGFSAGGISVTFRAEDESIVPLQGRTRAEAIKDEDASTSSRVVSGFGGFADSANRKDGWHNPNLWPSQAGRVLKFDGSYE